MEQRFACQELAGGLRESRDAGDRKLVEGDGADGGAREKDAAEGGLALPTAKRQTCEPFSWSKKVELAAKVL